MSGSPDCSKDITFLIKFKLPPTIKKSSPVKRNYRNPIYLAKECKKIIESGKVKNQTALAKLKGVSRARETQILNLLKLDKLVIKEIEQIGDQMERRIISERQLRKIINKNKKNNTCHSSMSQ